MFGPVVTNEAHLAFCGARAHSNNTADMIAMIEALSFLGLHALWPVMCSRAFIMILNTVLEFVWACAAGSGMPTI